MNKRNIRKEVFKFLSEKLADEYLVKQIKDKIQNDIDKWKLSTSVKNRINIVVEEMKEELKQKGFIYSQ